MKATLFRDFTEWCNAPQTLAMDDQSVRRARLRKTIGDDWGGNVSRFAAAAGKKQSQIADMLDGRKRFGEKVARSIEKAIGWPRGYLDDSQTEPMVKPSDTSTEPTIAPPLPSVPRSRIQPRPLGMARPGRDAA